jgi:hypothetical protein
MKMEDPGSSIENGGSILNPRSSILNPRSALVAILAAVWLTGGCHSGQSKPQTANSVSGTVFLNGKAINYGTVAFYNANGLQRKSIILIDGRYSVHNPPLGEVKIVVETGPAPVPASSPGGPGGEPIKFEKIDIPAHYSDPEKTDLRYTVTPGQHRFDINLKADRP